MLFISDRETGAGRLYRDLTLVGPCRSVPLHPPFLPVAATRMIVTDVSLDNQDSIRSLRRAIAHYRSRDVKVLCLLREDTHAARTQAREVGADETLAVNVPLHKILSSLEDSTETIAAHPLTLQARSGMATTSLASVLSFAEQGEAPDSKVLEKGATLVLDAIQAEGINAWLDVVWSCHNPTYQHSLLVAGFAAAAAIGFGFHTEDRKFLAKAALLHDIGKAFVPLEILDKASPLTADELVVMRSHTDLGYEYLEQKSDFTPDLLQIVRSHHEMLDGSGYPDGLSGRQIPDVLRLMTICDIYAALVERRSYKPPMGHDAALRILRDMGPKIDQGILKEFDRITGPR